MSGYGAFIEEFHSVDRHTESAGTTIDEQIQCSEGKRLALLFYSVVTGATAHVLYLLQTGALAGARNSTSAAAAAAQKVINVNTTPTDPAGNAAAASDIVAYRCTDGSWEFNVIASVATKAITHSTNLAKAVAAGAAYLIFGVAADGASQQFTLTASVTNVSPAVPIVAVNPYVGDPWYVQIGNATNASTIQTMLFAEINK
jgi:hypothetical protein